jgi:hypothetical protein
VSVFIAYLIASVFLSVYSFASTAILHCFLLDEETKGEHRPKSLESFIEINDKHNAQRKGKKGGEIKSEDADKKE